MLNLSRTRLFITIVSVVGLIGLSAYADDSFAPDGNLVPDNIADLAAPEQPISFSHEMHAGQLNLDCSFCHVSPVPGTIMTFPAKSICMSCHTEIAAESAEIQKLKMYFETDQAVPWKRVYEIYPGIKWSHKKHLGAGLQCKICHGDVKQLKVMKQVKAVVAMAICIDCHETTGVNASCETCHLWPADDYLLTKD